MEVMTSRFGTVPIPLGETICFPSGLIGFEDCQSWVLLAPRPNDSVIWLQSTQVPDIALPVVDPRAFEPEFTLQVEQTDWTPLGKREEDSSQSKSTVIIRQLLRAHDRHNRAGLTNRAPCEWPRRRDVRRKHRKASEHSRRGGFGPPVEHSRDHTQDRDY